MELTLGFVSAFAMGMSLGLIGGGGSILSVPILVYLFGVGPVLATAYSLFVVGLTSLIGSLSHIKQGNIEFKIGVIFAIPSFIGVFLTRKYIVPAIPDRLFALADFVVSKDTAIMVFFSIIMLMAAFSMIRKLEDDTNVQGIQKQKRNYALILIEGLAVGSITGLVGAGGGFLIIPALVVMAKLPMKQAVGTSLLIIAAKSLLGFLGDVSAQAVIDWIFLLKFSAIAMGGVLFGSYSSKFVSNEKLKAAFGWLVLVMGLYIIGKELLYNAL